MGLDNVVGLVRNLMHLSANVGDFGDDGDVPSLWSQLPKIIVVGGQVRPGSGCACSAPPICRSLQLQRDLQDGSVLI